MRFLIELELTTVVPLVIDADSKKDALEALRSTTENELPFGDPIPEPPTVRRVTELGD